MSDAEITGRRVSPPMLANQQLVTAMKHPTRAHAVTVLNERVACAAEIGREIGKPSGHVSYHLLQLEKYGVIELVKEVAGRGGATTSKFYRALARSWYDPESWKQVESKHQPGITAGILASCNSDLSTAVQFGTIHFPDNHLSRTPILVDPVGYRELVERLDTLLPEVIEMQQRAAGRMSRGEETVLAKVHIIQFPSPDAGSRAIPIVVAPPSGARLPELSEDEVLLAMEHPTRVHALMVLNERISSAAEIGREIDVPSHNVSYHLKMLKRLGLIELVETVETPGGRLTGKYYRALIRPWFDLEGWMKVDPKRQVAITSTILDLCNADISEAVRVGTINNPDSHISRTPVVVDRETYREMVFLLDRAISDVLLIQEQSKQRLLEGADRVATKMHLFFFESPDPELD